MTTDSATASHVHRPTPRRRWTKVIVIMLMVLSAVLLVAAVGVPWSLYRQIGDAGVDLDDLPQRPSKSAAASGALDIAVLGTVDDRCVSLMLFHIDANRRDAAFVSVPDTPECGPDAGPMTRDDPQSVATQLEQTSGVRLDHLAILDWEAIAGLDSVADGVEVRLDGPAFLPWPNEYQTVTADNLADFVGYPVSSPDQESVRIRRQQLVLQNVLRATLHQEMRKEPWTVYQFLDVVTTSLALDADWSWFDLSRLAVSLRNMRSGDITFHTADAASNLDLWNSVREDTIGAG